MPTIAFSSMHGATLLVCVFLSFILFWSQVKGPLSTFNGLFLLLGSHWECYSICSY